jgi:hypothetical protein
MANTFKIGDTVKQVVPVVQGVVLEKKFIEDDICYRVEFTDAAGDKHERWFKESELEGV